MATIKKSILVETPLEEVWGVGTDANHRQPGMLASATSCR